MASPVTIYQQQMHDNLGFFATWLPGDQLDLGEAGVLEGGRFRKQSSLAELGITCESSPEGAAQTLQYQSTEETKIDLHATGATEMPKAGAQVTIDFSREGAFLFQAVNVRQLRIANRAHVAGAILKAYEKGKWKKEWFLVESLQIAQCATIMVALDRSARLVLKASAPIQLGDVPLANAKAKFSVISSRGTIVHVLGGRDLRPLFSCLRLKESWFSNPSIVPVRGVADNSIDVFVRASINELIDS